jgi:hypothetical protein
MQEGSKQMKDDVLPKQDNYKKLLDKFAEKYLQYNEPTWEETWIP